MDKTTKVFIEDFKGHPTISVWEVDPAGNKAGKYPLVAFGVRKAKAILTHLEEIKKFTEDKRDA